ncbi:HAD family hydrolase [Gorillibacterium massiliense]|uniref:HAD family hydrolase n=1 Tax=Gorillibacterium massiliense TaxID=1280390 RepID=UPI0004B4D493|nr:HAD family hydrolase [Gorillibacterium massiliense]
MKPFDAISLDMFQTLVDFASRKDNVWEVVLGEKYNADQTPELSRQVLGLLHERMRQNEGDFSTMASIFAFSFADCFERNSIQFDPEKAAELMLAEHGRAELYPDAERFLTAARGVYPLFIVSDADDVMIPGAFVGEPYSLFTSESYQSYKNDRYNHMFKRLLQDANLAPGRVLHIGDSPGDVLGAKREGLKACWLNRDQNTWKYEEMPDYTVSSFDELHELLFG